MKAEIRKDISEHGVPYCELLISPSWPEDGMFFITFRRYPKRVFVAVEDYSNDQTGGADLEDCWTAPSYIVEKTLFEDFNPFLAFKKALVFLAEWETPSDPGEPDYDRDYWAEQWAMIVGDVEKWKRLSY